MKKPFLYSAIVFVCALVPAVPYTAFAQTAVQEETSSIDAAIFPAPQDMKLWMVVDQASSTGKVHVELVDKSNKVLYSEYLPKRKRAYRQQFDMRSMTDGLYTFRITDGNKTIEKTFKLATPTFNEQLPQRFVTMN